MPLPGQVLKPMVQLGRKPDDCWTWLGPKTANGHGLKTFHGQTVMAHRWLWEQLFGPIAKGMVVYATCATKGCVNPHHLACGFQSEANRQSVQTKLLPSDIAAIRAAKAEAGPNTARVLAERYDITPGHVREIWTGRVWGRSKRNSGPRMPSNQHARCAALALNGDMA